MSPSEWDEKPDADPRLTRAAEQVADATPVEWPDSEPGPLAETLRGLRVLDSLARAHREAGAAFESRAAQPPRTPLFTWGGLEVLEPVARGSFGEVYRAFDPALGRDVALKLRPADAGAASSTAHWLEEARRLARVRHPHVLTVYGAGVHDGRAGLWTELVSGETLEQRLARQGPWGAKEATAIALDLCAALAAVHAEGLVHGDLTTRNVMRAAGGRGAPADAGRIVLMDFGSAHERSVGDAESWSIGTPLACAPEVLNGARPDVRADVYSFGVLLFRLVTGRYPVEAATLDELQARHARGERLALRSLRADLPAPFVDAVEGALAPDPARRIAGAAALERALSASLGDGRASRAFRIAPTRLAALAIAGLVVAGAVVIVPRLAHVPAAPNHPAVASAESPTVSPPANAPAPAAAPAPGRALVAHAALYRGDGAEATEVRDGTLLAVGDHLYLEVEPLDTVSVYVLDEDRTGQVVVMFPVANVDAANPIAGGGPHRLPGTIRGRSFDWQVTSAGGRETFLVVVSRHPLPEIEHRVAALEQASTGRELAYASLPPEALDDLRGVSGLVPSPAEPANEDDGRLAALAKGLAHSPHGDVWTLLIHARNPGS